MLKIHLLKKPTIKDFLGDKRGKLTGAKKSQQNRVYGPAWTRRRVLRGTTATQPHPFTCIVSEDSTTQPSSCDRDHVARRVSTLYYLAFYRKMFANYWTGALNNRRELVTVFVGDGDDSSMVTTHVLKRSRLKYLGVNYHDDCGSGSGTVKSKKGGS